MLPDSLRRVVTVCLCPLGIYLALSVLILIPDISSKANPLTQRNSIDQEAQKEAEAFWKGIIVKCGESSTWEFTPKNGNRVGTKIYEARGLINVKVKGHPQQQRPLTEAEKLNGVKPSGKQWVGKTWVEVKVLRNGAVQRDLTTKWERWIDNMSSENVDLIKENGEWKIDPQNWWGIVKLGKCSDLQ
jgi:hypothetical protein